MPVTSWSTVAGNNNSAPPDGAPEGMSPSGVNNCIRQVMADVARESQINNVKVLKSVAGTNTITADMDPELASYSAGMMIVLTPANNCTGATTLNIDGLGALDVQKQDGDALISGDLVAGIPALLVLDSGADDWVLINPQATVVASSFTGSLSGMTGAVSPSVSYIVASGIATLACTGSSGTSNAGTMVLSGVPAIVTPAANKYVPCVVVDNGVNTAALASVTNANTIEFFLLTGVTYTGSFTGSGTKGLAAGWTISYPL